jgi:small subunit ribosomal protein S20
LTARSTSAYKRGERGWATFPALIAIQAAARNLLASAAAAKERGFMANTKSAQKAVRKIARRTAINKNRRSQMRTSVRKVEEALEAKDAAAAAEAFRAAEPLLARSGQKGLVHKNAASRKISRLAKRVKALAV